jgi:deoxyribodipyrimidine photo-lyase
MVPETRSRALNDAPIDPKGRYVLYWMTAFRRLEDNFALDRAIEEAKRLGKGLLVFEALRVGYRWASDRHHRFVLQGMAENAAKLEAAGIAHQVYVEPEIGAGRGLLAALAADAALVIGDDYPCFFLPRMIEAAAKQLAVRFEVVDSNGLLPMRTADRTFLRAVDFRRFLQKTLPDHLGAFPKAKPLASLDLPKPRLPSGVSERWPKASASTLAADPQALAKLPIDHSVGPAAFAGGASAAIARWKAFAASGLPEYAEGRNHPDQDRASGLSPYLHFGQISVHRIFRELAGLEGWRRERLSPKATAEKEGWWGMSPGAEAFLDELITWREIGFNACHRERGYDRFDSLPEWCRATLERHASDPRPHRYDLATLEAAKTADEVWNAAQRQLVAEGRMHNYLRMLWGKKILEWSKSPRDALEVMIELNNKYAVDGRDPNSYSGIFWVLGRYDRPWAPEREIFGTIRYMSSDNTVKKLRMKGYLAKYGKALSFGF